MMSLGIFELGLVIFFAIFATSIFWGSIWFFWRSEKTQTVKLDPIVFLLDDISIRDTSPVAGAFLARSGLDDGDRGKLLATLGDIFPELDLTRSDDQTYRAADDSDTTMTVHNRDGVTRLTLTNATLSPAQIIDTLCENAQTMELDGLRQAAKSSPTLMWQHDTNGHLVWANDAYLGMIEQCGEPTQLLPCKPTGHLFDDLETELTQSTTSTRRSLKIDGQDSSRWFDISAAKSDSGTFFHAVDATPIVQAELTQRNFMQTLSQTFAQLSIGLAIFDRNRQLATFNPALLDMTNLDFEFLSTRPTLDTIFDRLRDSRMLPEPKNYASWRDQFSAMEQAAKNGTYCENWNLPDGQTFRVTGRPHPDGAIALLFEDISAEISLTRRFRLEIETSQAVIDNFSEAVAVFSNSGNLVLANASYCALWGTDLSKDLLQYDLRIELRKWQDRCTPSRIWTNLHEFNTQMGMREPWSDTAIMDDGRHVTCLANPIAGGMTLIRFRFDRPQRPSIQKILQEDPALLSLKG